MAHSSSDLNCDETQLKNGERKGGGREGEREKERKEKFTPCIALYNVRKVAMSQQRRL